MLRFLTTRALALIVLVSLTVTLLCSMVTAQTPADIGNQGTGSNYLSSTNPYYASDYRNNHSTSDPYYIYQCTWYVWGRCADAEWTLNAAPGADTEYSAITNGSGKGQTPQLGAIECCYYGSGSSATYHVCYVYHVDSPTSWEIAQFNVPLYAGYSTEQTTQSSSTATNLSNSKYGPTTLVGFIYPPSGSNGSASSPTTNVGLINSSGAYYSINSGSTWTQLVTPGNSPTSISVSGSSVGIVNAQGAFYSVNGGGTWTQLNSPSNGPTVISVDASYVGLINSSGAYYSINGGSTWTQLVSSSNYPTYISVGQGSVGIIDAQGAYYSSNGGSTWTQLVTPSNSPTCISVIGASIGVINSGGAFYSTNAGSTWTQLVTPSNYPTSISVNGNTVGIVNSGGAFYSVNSGSTWTQLNSSSNGPIVIAVG